MVKDNDEPEDQDQLDIPDELQVKEDCTLPHLFRRNPLESVGFHWSPVDSIPGLCQCDKGQIGIFSPGGVQQSPVESGIFRWSLRIPTRLFQQSCPPDSAGLHQLDSVQYIPPDSFRQIPLDSVRRISLDSVQLLRVLMLT